jgi:glyoxylate/hydroxypyruvate reductase A
MSIVLIHQRSDLNRFKKLLQKQLPSTSIFLYDEVENPDEVEFAITWKHKHGAFSKFKNLKVIASFGAGVYHIISDSNLPKDVKITKIVNDQLTKDMCDFVLMNCLNFIRNTPFHFKNQELMKWEATAYQPPKEVNVGVLGLGTLGKAVAETLVSRNFKVRGWSNSKKEIDGVESYTKTELNSFLQQTNILICLLPLTEETKNILNKDVFDQLPKNTCLINVARGQHLDEKDLQKAIEDGIIKTAFIDVFNEEPLPKEHWFWKNEAVQITPHIASLTKPEEVVTQLAENYKRFKSGKSLKYEINKIKSY